VIALHHAGSKDGISRLNGERGIYPGNEGISMASILDTARREIPDEGAGPR
jgi:hypothetical protein